MFVSAHYDGHQILLDEPTNLKPDTKLLVDIPDDDQTVEEERREWTRFALTNFARMYEDEPDLYTEDMIIEPNPNYRDPWEDCSR